LDKGVLKKVSKKQKNKLGFTLIELLVVVSIISLLSSVVLVNLNTARAKARDATRLSDIRQLQTTLELYYENEGKYPTVFTAENGWDRSCQAGDFLKPLKDKNLHVPIDPLNTDNVTECPGNDSTNFHYVYQPCEGGDCSVLKTDPDGYRLMFCPETDIQDSPYEGCWIGGNCNSDLQRKWYCVGINYK
jgi:prepilin-type N-terminal cleavage/methylation domain-containing protein